MGALVDAGSKKRSSLTERNCIPDTPEYENCMEDSSRKRSSNRVGRNTAVIGVVAATRRVRRGGFGSTGSSKSSSSGSSGG